MNRYTELEETLRTKNAGKHYLFCRDKTECVEELCSEIDQLRTQLTALREAGQELAGATEKIAWDCGSIYTFHDRATQIARAAITRWHQSIAAPMGRDEKP